MNNLEKFFLFLLLFNILLSSYFLYADVHQRNKDLEFKYDKLNESLKRYEVLKEEGFFRETNISFRILSESSGQFVVGEKTIVLDMNKSDVLTVVHEYAHYIWYNKMYVDQQDFYCDNYHEPNMFLKEVDKLYINISSARRCGEDFARSFTAYISTDDRLDARRIKYFEMLQYDEMH